MLDDYFYLGKITKKFGLAGELVVYLDTDEPQKYWNMESVFFDIDGEPIPFFIKNSRNKANNQMVVLFENMNNDSCEQYVGTELYLPLNLLPPLSGNKFYYHEIIDFEVIDKQAGSLGKCSNIIDYGQQSLIQIFTSKGEILIPIIDEFILKVDRKAKKLTVQTPPGLTQLNLL